MDKNYYIILKFNNFYTLLFYFNITYKWTIIQSQREKQQFDQMLTTYPSTFTYEEGKVDHHSEATVMTTNSAYGLQHTLHC